MTISNIDVEATINRVKALTATEKDLSPALKAMKCFRCPSCHGVLTLRPPGYVPVQL